jgi:hypothetical protein
MEGPDLRPRIGSREVETSGSDSAPGGRVTVDCEDMPEGAPGIGGADGLDIPLDGGDALLDVRKSWRRPTESCSTTVRIAKILNR